VAAAAPRSTGEASGDGEVPDLSRASSGRWGSREVEITDVQFLDAAGQPQHVFDTGAPAAISVRVHATAAVSDFVFGIGIFNADGVCCYGTNTDIEGAVPAELAGDGEVRFAIDHLDLIAGTYKVDVAVHRQNGAPYDYHRQLHTLRVNSRVKDVGVFRPRHRWTFSGGIRVTMQQGPGDNGQPTGGRGQETGDGGKRPEDAR
jgi:hypothetical protein